MSVWNVIDGIVKFPGTKEEYLQLKKLLEKYSCEITKIEEGSIAVEMDSFGSCSTIPKILDILEPVITDGVLNTLCEEDLTRYVFDREKKEFIGFPEKRNIYRPDDAVSAFPDDLVKKITNNAEQMAFVGAIVDIFEDFLEEKAIVIPNDDHQGSEGEANIYGSDYDVISDELKKLFRNYGIFPNSEK